MIDYSTRFINVFKLRNGCQSKRIEELSRAIEHRFFKESGI